MHAGRAPLTVKQASALLPNLLQLLPQGSSSSRSPATRPEKKGGSLSTSGSPRAVAMATGGAFTVKRGDPLPSGSARLLDDVRGVPGSDWPPVVWQRL